jgi:hypothetical protein
MRSQTGPSFVFSRHPFPCLIYMLIMGYIHSHYASFLLHPSLALCQSHAIMY